VLPSTRIQPASRAARAVQLAKKFRALYETYDSLLFSQDHSLGQRMKLGFSSGAGTARIFAYKLTFEGFKDIVTCCRKPEY
jgi:hypothetical protein